MENMFNQNSVYFEMGDCASGGCWGGCQGDCHGGCKETCYGGCKETCYGASK